MESHGSDSVLHLVCSRVFLLVYEYGVTHQKLLNHADDEMTLMTVVSAKQLLAKSLSLSLKLIDCLSEG